MDERARLLAQTPEQAPDTNEILEVITFRLGSERFAVETRFVCEVYEAGVVTPLPGSPRPFVGVTNLRGEILAVVDLREWFGVAPADGNQRTQLVIVGAERPEFGMVVDEVDEVRPLRIDEVFDPPGSVAGASRDWLRGVTEGALLVLDGHALLNDERLYVDEGRSPQG